MIDIENANVTGAAFAGAKVIPIVDSGLGFWGLLAIFIVVVLLLGIMTVIGTLISDLLLMWIEPRLRLTGRS